MKYVILLLVYAINLISYLIWFRPVHRTETVLKKGTVKTCEYPDEWEDTTTCEIKKENQCTTGKGELKQRKLPLDKFVKGRTTPCPEKKRVTECVQKDACKLTKGWENMYGNEMYANTLHSYIDSKKHFEETYPDINKCTYECDRVDGSVAILSHGDSEELSCTCWTLATNLGPELDGRTESVIVYDEDNNTYMQLDELSRLPRDHIKDATVRKRSVTLE